MKPLRCLALCWLLTLCAARAQVPGADEMAAAVRSAEPQARRVGLALQPGVLWWAALRERSPMVAAYHQGVCQLGFAPYTPGRDYGWLFPALAPAQRVSWLAGLVQHELAHCAEQAALHLADEPPGAGALAAGGSGTRWHEVLADLAFALHVDEPPSDTGAQQIRLMASLRARHARLDPAHDTSPELLCYLHWRADFKPAGAWLQRLQAWRQQCWQSPAGR